MAQTEQFLGNAAEIYLFLIGLFVLIFSLLACIVLVYSLRKHRAGVCITNYPTITSVIFYFISSILFVSALTHFNEHDNDNFEHDDTFVICTVLFVIFLILAKLSIYMQFLGRVYAAFKGSLLALNKITIIISISLLFIILITVIWWITLIVLRYIHINDEFNGYYIQFYPVFIFLFISDFTLSWLVVGLFINKLFKTIMFRSRQDFFAKTQRRLNGPSTPEADEKQDNNNNNNQTINANISRKDSSIDTPQNSNDSNTPVTIPLPRARRSSLMLDLAFNSINETDKKRLDVITRLFILSSLSIMTTQLCYVSFIIILIIKTSSNNKIMLNQNALFAVYCGIFYPMDVVFNCIALYFNYQFANKYYNIWCKCCHRQCSLCVVRNASKQIVSRHSMEIIAISVHKSVAIDK
eukprot:390324_1